MSQIIEIASREIGIKEIPGTEDNIRILKYAQEAGFNNINRETVAWCSIFLNWVALKTGMEMTNSAMARSWLRVGKKILNPIPGDIAIFWRENPNSNKGHVGIFMGYSKNRKNIYILGGNQSNAVSIKAYKVSQLLGFRRLRPTTKTELPNQLLQWGDYGLAVVKLQEVLNLMGFLPSTADGLYDQDTYEAVWFLQDQSDNISPNGIFDKTTRDYLLERLDELA